MPRSRKTPAAAALASGVMLLALMMVEIGQAPHRFGMTVAEWSVRMRFPDVRRITTEELAEWLADPLRAQPILLDTRAQEEFDVSHLPGAVRGVTPPPGLESQPIVLYCSIGWRSAEAARRLTHDGVPDVRNLEGSIFAWATEGRPLVKDGRPVRKVHPYDAEWGRLLPDALRSDRE